ncbi:helix-turn-helix domain-containing protein [Aneurinibacillus thermoaerophilus]|uniref:helix-turn-helix domain-containing protein n=1 Tax=Aneurinibacillus thermoaerophilus TaxID=143495 RepID=UPI002E1CFE3C|nr:helix-turn-helix domain-containing protein [Aneurinibacillus thermoaerophilus]
MGFRERLKELRSKKGITQEQLAAHLDIPESTIRRYESVEDSLPRRERLDKIADFFGVSIDYLLGRTDDVLLPSAPSNSGLGERIKYLREKRGWTQSQAAEKLGVSSQVISNYERDYRSPDADTLKKLAELYNTTTDYLTGLIDDPSPRVNNPTMKKEDSPNKEPKLNLFFHDGLEGYDDLDPEAQEAFRQYMREEAKRAIEFAKKLKKQGKRGGMYER